VRIGILGGSFDPIHIGHLEIAQRAMCKHSLDRVFFVPAYKPPHKTMRILTDWRKRVEMIKKAIANEPRFEVSDVECKRGGISYTIDTLNYFRERFPNAELFFIIGTDSLEELPTWRSIGDAMRIARFVSVLRGNYDETVFKRLEKVFGKERTRQLREDAILEPPINVSSTEIRRRVKEKQPIDGMVPESVIEYIKENRLYIEK